MIYSQETRSMAWFENLNEKQRAFVRTKSHRIIPESMHIVFFESLPDTLPPELSDDEIRQHDHPSMAPLTKPLSDSEIESVEQYHKDHIAPPTSAPPEPGEVKETP